MMEATNHIIRDGIVIAGKRSWARQLHRELRRCLKCQSLSANHLAAECKQPNVCGTCGKEHRTAKCEVEDSNPEHTYRFFPNQEPWTWEQTSDEGHREAGGWHNAGGTRPQDDGGWSAENGQMHTVAHSLGRPGPCKRHPDGEVQGRSEPCAMQDRAQTAGVKMGPVDQGWGSRASRQCRVDEHPQGKVNSGLSECLQGGCT